MFLQNVKIGGKMLIGFGSILTIFLCLGIYVYISLQKINASSVHIKDESIPFAIQAEQMALAVSQVQQFLSDVGATRDPLALKEADNSAANFKAGIAKFSAMYKKENDGQSLQKIQVIDRDFDAFFAMGKRMAQTYIAEGTEGGNRVMRDFDALSARLLDEINAFTTSQTTEANEMANKVQHTVARLTSVFAGVLLLTMVIGAGIAVVITRSITRPIAISITELEKIAAGDLTIKLDESARDETGWLARTINRMAGDMGEVVAAMIKASTNLASASQELLAQTEQMARNTESIAAQSETSATALQQLAATASDIAQNCQLASDFTTRATNQTHSSYGIIKETVDGMQRISEKVSHASGSVMNLGAKSDQIGLITSTIEDIADQTNLLALNAAIEAARAGEQGRGFAVVADEVRALAERTSRATKEISDMVRAIQSETSTSVQAMEQGVSEVSSGAHGASRSAAAMEEILVQISGITSQVSQIAVASEQQNATTSELSNTVNQISGVLETNSRGIEETAVAARVLAQLADELSATTSQFRIAD